MITAAKVHRPAGAEAPNSTAASSLSAGLLLLLLALDQSADWGWGDWRVIAMLALSTGLIITFGVIEPRMGSAALIPADIAANRRFTSACVTVLLMSAVFFTVVLCVPQLMEKLLDYSALEAGVGMLPMLAVFAVVAFFAGRLYERIGGRPVIIAGSVCLAVGPFLLSLFEADSGYGILVPGMIVADGVGLFYPSITTAAVTALDESAQPRRGHRLHVPDRRRGDRAEVDDRDLHDARRTKLAAEAAEAGSNLTAHQTAVLHGDLAGTDAAAAALSQLPASAAG